MEARERSDAFTTSSDEQEDTNTKESPTSAQHHQTWNGPSEDSSRRSSHQVGIPKLTSEHKSWNLAQQEETPKEMPKDESKNSAEQEETLTGMTETLTESSEYSSKHSVKQEEASTNSPTDVFSHSAEQTHSTISIRDDSKHSEEASSASKPDGKESDLWNYPQHGLKGWQFIPFKGSLRRYMKVDSTMLRHKWKNVQKLVYSHVRNSSVIYTAGCLLSVASQPKPRAAWAFVAEKDHAEVFRKSSRDLDTFERVNLEVKAITAAFEWLKSQGYSEVVMVSDCMSLLNKIRCGRLHGDWMGILLSSKVMRVTWVFSPSRSGFETNRTAHDLARDTCKEGFVDS